MDQSILEDLSSKETPDIHNTATSFLTQQMDTIDLNDTEYEKLEQQVEELTKQLNESKSTEKHANDEREKYLQMYNHINERFLAFEHKQLDQIRRILSNILTSDQHETLSENQDDSSRSEQSFTNSSVLPSSLDQSLDAITDHQKNETDWNDVLTEISEIMDFAEKFITKYSEQTEENNKLRLLNSQKHEENVKLRFDFSLLQAKYEKEQQIRNQFEKQFHETNKLIEMDHSKRLQKLRNYATLADDEGDILLSSLMRKAEKNDLDFQQIKFQYENLFIEQVDHIKKLVKERELLHLYIQRLEEENSSLAGRTNDDETIQLLTHSSQKPSSYEEAWDLINQLREEIVQQIKIQDKLRNDTQQLQHNHETDIREREQIEELLNRDLTTAKDQNFVLETIRSEYEHLLKVKINLEKTLEEYTNKLITIESGTNALINHLKEQTEQISLEKERLEEENAALRAQLQKLKIDFENSESVQHDFVKLSQALQVQLEEFRNSENQSRWEHEEDFSECQRCHIPFSVTWRKQHCRHCGKVLCKECVNKTVYSGRNNRPSRVCNICYTLLNKNSQPYFLAGIPKV